MASVRRRGDLTRVTLDREEAVLLVSLVTQVARMLEVGQPDVEADPNATTFEQLVAGLDATAETPEDPILKRLLPDGYNDDPESAEEFRRLTDSELRATKATALHRVRDDVAAAEAKDGGKKVQVDIDEAAAEAWLHGVNDVRLALGTHLDIREEGDAEERANAVTEDVRASYAIYDWLTWLQESIVRQLID